MKKPKIVLDTNILVTALKSKQGASYKLLSLLEKERYTIALSVPLVLEYEEILKRIFPRFGKTAIEQFVDYLCAVGEPAEIFYIWRPQLKDPDDEMLLELAVASNAAYIVTYNKMDLIGSNKFGIKVLTPKEFLQLLGEIP
jgi:putative PIN family toxin of toxin-antitoxin system